MLRMEVSKQQRVLSATPSEGKAEFNPLCTLLQTRVMGHDDSPTLGLQGAGRAGFILFYIKIESKQTQFLNRSFYH